MIILNKSSFYSIRYKIKYWTPYHFSEQPSLAYTKNKIKHAVSVEYSRMKNGSFIITISYGEMVDERKLKKILRKERNLVNIIEKLGSENGSFPFDIKEMEIIDLNSANAEFPSNPQEFICRVSGEDVPIGISMPGDDNEVKFTLKMWHSLYAHFRGIKTITKDSFLVICGYLLKEMAIPIRHVNFTKLLAIFRLMIKE